MTTVADVTGLYERWGADPYDEEVAQIDHARQTAARAVAAGAPDTLVVAALLHDIGHLLALRGDPPAPHEQVGPTFLAGLFPAAVTGPVALHVAAKRYLCAVEPAYASVLSAGSVRSLARQGGPMSPVEAATFEAAPGWRDAVALRRWDDAGKVDGASVAAFDSYLPVLRSVAC